MVPVMSDTPQFDTPPGGEWVPAAEVTPSDPSDPAAEPSGPGSPLPPSGWAAAGGWAHFPPPPGPVASGSPWRRFPAAAAAVVLLLVAGAGFGAGHLAWPGTGTPTSAGTPSTGNGNSGIGGGPGGGGRFFGNGGGQFFGNGGSGSASGGTLPEASGGPSDVNAIAAKVDPGLVDVNSSFSYQQAEGAGTGIVLSSDGLILTNNHVINGATKISVTDIGNGKTYSARVVGYDPSQDVALLQLSGASGLTTARLGNSAKLSVGQAVVAIGNAGGAGGTPAAAGGSITAMNQSIDAGDELDGNVEKLTGLIETNADIQSGDSGGSLVDTAGNVVGVDTAATQQFAFENSSGQGYAIPINEALSIVKQIRSGRGTSAIHVGPTAFLGLLINPGNSGGAGNGGFGGSTGGGSPSGSGASVSGVVSGGAAANAGIAAGDTITAVDGQAVTSASGLSAQLLTHHPADRVTLTWADSNGASHSATVSLGSGPPA
jgi:S1-C subfamily serine protease